MLLVPPLPSPWICANYPAASADRSWVGGLLGGLDTRDRVDRTGRGRREVQKYSCVRRTVYLTSRSHINVPLQPRRLTIAPAAVGCKPLDVVPRSRIRAPPSLSSFPALPDDHSRKCVDSDPMQCPILFARREEAVQCLTSKLLWNKQLRWPSFERLSSKIDFDRRRPARNTSEQEVAPSLLIFVALDDESMALVPLDVKKRKLVVGRGDRSAVPDRTRPNAREDLRHGRNRNLCLARDEREPKRVLEINAHTSGFSRS